MHTYLPFFVLFFFIYHFMSISAKKGRKLKNENCNKIVIMTKLEEIRFWHIHRNRCTRSTYGRVNRLPHVPKIIFLCFFFFFFAQRVCKKFSHQKILKTQKSRWNWLKISCYIKSFVYLLFNLFGAAFTKSWKIR